MEEFADFDPHLLDLPKTIGLFEYLCEHMRRLLSRFVILAALSYATLTLQKNNHADAQTYAGSCPNNCDSINFYWSCTNAPLAVWHSRRCSGLFA
jgi:hypothetical protein